MKHIILALGILIGGSLRALIIVAFFSYAGSMASGTYERLNLLSYAAYIPGVMLAAWLVRAITLKERLPDKIPLFFLIRAGLYLSLLALVVNVVIRTVPYAVYFLAVVPFARVLMTSPLFGAVVSLCLFTGLAAMFLAAKALHASSSKPFAMLHVVLALGIVLGSSVRGLVIDSLFRFGMVGRTAPLWEIYANLVYLPALVIAVVVVRKIALAQRLTERPHWFSLMTTATYVYLAALLLNSGVNAFPALRPPGQWAAPQLFQALAYGVVLAGLFAVFLAARPRVGTVEKISDVLDASRGKSDKDGESK